jgi:dephospho-CoA kinase
MARPILIGLTGSIGMGKSETARMFAEFGFPVYDADAAVHSLYQPCGEAVEPVAKAFPGAVKDGAVDRTALAAILQKDPANFAKLEAIVHPLAAKQQRAFVAAALEAGAEMAVLDVPLLFESGGDSRVDIVVVVSAPEDIQRQRAMARPGMTAEKFSAIVKRQMPDEEKCLLADYVVDTGQGLEYARQQVRKIVEDLRQKQSGPQ